MIQFVDNLDSSVTLQVVVDDSGSTAGELAVQVETMPGLEITNATINGAVFDTPNPGDNPFIPGLQIGGDSTGLWTDLPAGQVFASYGSGILAPGAYDYLTIEYEGMGTLSASGLVAQGGVNFAGLSASIDVVPEPTAALLALGGLACVATLRRRR